jgi:glutamate N-acetyltransferase/amino-acid N-acetyltransferase
MANDRRDASEVSPGTVAAVESFELAPGFRAAATACGLKPSGNLDLTLIVADADCSAAGVFTTNRVKAAPVIYDRSVLDAGAGAIRAVIANSGCANACTGAPGMEDARAMAALAASVAGASAEQVLVLSTGVIGKRLDLAAIGRGVRGMATAFAGVAAPARDSSLSAPEPGGLVVELGGFAAARAVMTTDTRAKTASADVSIGGGVVTIRGFAKGAGMIHPNLATMLSVITTDARVSPSVLDAALRAVTRRTFDRVSVDGDMSTNDTVLLLASGASGVAIDEARLPVFVSALEEVCRSLARQIARDGEGATRLVEIVVTGAESEARAHAVANRIACSLLVKTAIHGSDPNWGRVLAAAGAAGVHIDPERLSLFVGAPSQEIAIASGGMGLEFDRAVAARRLSDDPARFVLDLGLGSETATVWTCDLSDEYVAINAEYTT